MALTMAGYRAAPMILLLSNWAASRSSAKLPSTSAKLPLRSPALTTAQYTSSNSAGCCAKACEKALPALTCASTSPISAASCGSCVPSPKLCRARSMFNPASTSDASCRVHTANSAARSTARGRSSDHAAARPPAAAGLLSSCTCTGTKPWARNAVRAALGDSASTKPFWVWPWGPRAS